MKLLTASLALACLAVACCAQEFTLQDDKGETTGPFALKEGTEVVVGTNKAFITQVRTQKHQLLDDIREIVILEVEFKQASLRDAVTQLQQAAANADPKKRNLPIAFDFTPEQEKEFKSTPLTCHARNISLLDALRLVTELTNVKYGVCKGVITIMPLDAPEGELFKRNYRVMPSGMERITEGMNSAEILGGENASNPENLKKRLAKLGVPWPAGSSVSYLSIEGKLVACNTRENLDLLGELLEEFGGVPHQIRIEVQFVSFDLAQINRLTTSGVGINTAALTALWTNGFGELVAAPSAITKAGQEVDVKGVTEVIYPTAFDWNATCQTNAVGTNSPSATNNVAQSLFQTRETGPILQVVPEVNSDGTLINLTLNPQFIEEPAWHDFGPANLEPNAKNRFGPMKQPFFHVFSASTSVSVLNGKRVLIGGGMPTKDRKRAVYVFATATLEDEQGIPFHSLTGNDEHLNQPYDTSFIPRFSLRDEKGVVTGPFPLMYGVRINVRSRWAIITQVMEDQTQLPDAMRTIVLPDVSFREASIRDVIASLRQLAVENDPKKRGINLMTFGLTAEQGNAGKITFSARYVSLYNALKIITEVANFKCRVRGDFVVVVPHDAPDGEFFVRRYTVPSPGAEINGDGFVGRSNDVASCAARIKQTLGDCGIPWPNGSSVMYLSAGNRLFIRNTRENLHILDNVMEEMNVTPRQIQIDAQFVSFDRTNIACIAASGTGFSTAALTALWTNGCGELLAAPTVVTKAGQEAVVKGVTEVIYPTQFTSPDAVQTNAMVSGSGPVEPGGFQTRETGAILQVVPEVSAEGQMINLTLNPQLVDDPTWEDFGPVIRDATGKEHPSQITQPFFHVHSPSTSVSLANGHRVLVGGGMPSRDRKRAVYLFVTATLIDPSGNAIRMPDDKDELDLPVK